MKVASNLRSMQQGKKDQKGNFMEGKRRSHNKTRKA